MPKLAAGERRAKRQGDVYVACGSPGEGDDVVAAVTVDVAHIGQLAAENGAVVPQRHRREGLAGGQGDQGLPGCQVDEVHDVVAAVTVEVAHIKQIVEPESADANPSRPRCEG